MRFPGDYPYSPPTVKFLSKMWHPNVYEVCLSFIHLLLFATNFSRGRGVPDFKYRVDLFTVWRTNVINLLLKFIEMGEMHLRQQVKFAQPLWLRVLLLLICHWRHWFLYRWCVTRITCSLVLSLRYVLVSVWKQPDWVTYGMFTWMSTRYVSWCVLEWWSVYIYPASSGRWSSKRWASVWAMESNTECSVSFYSASA